ncbi:hypothetical protein BA1DRAFT_01079, partial [Photorhabdus aegyptia]
LLKTFLLVLANPTFSHLDILDQITYLGQPLLLNEKLFFEVVPGI